MNRWHLLVASMTLTALAAKAQSTRTDVPSVAANVLEQGGPLRLTCIGGGSANKLDAINSYGSASVSGTAIGSGGTATFDASGSSSGTAYVPRTQSFDDQVDLSIEHGEGRIRVPRVMLPLIRGGENGWFKIKDLRISTDAITASVAINVINNPKLRVDRRTGVINLSGKAGDFVGRCRKVDPEVNGRQF